MNEQLDLEIKKINVMDFFVHEFVENIIKIIRDLKFQNLYVLLAGSIRMGYP